MKRAGGVEMLKGKAVVLRATRRSDVPFFLQWFNDPEVTQYLSMDPPMTEMAENKWLDELATTRAATDVVFVIEVATNETNKPIGICGLHRIDHKNQTAEFGITIGEKISWGKGYGTGAAHLLINYGFRQLNLHHLSSCVLEFNERSIKFLRKIGFRKEGRHQQAKFKSRTANFGTNSCLAC
jgi:RimJ/RimL family protein N-acetyltransferase